MAEMHVERPTQALFDRLGLTVFERGWLSSNCLLFHGEGPSALVDSGYSTHASQTLALVREALGEEALDLLLNTHLHSDHCGGNRALQHTYPDVKTCIPPGLAEAVAIWDPVALTFEPTGQLCERFTFDDLLYPGDLIQLGPLCWEVHAAKGHDPHSIILFQRENRVLISADALWENGFGVVFPELDGISAFDEVANTLDTIEQLAPALVLPGHGSPFCNVQEALKRARSRLESFMGSPEKHTRYAAKVLIKFKLLEWQEVTYARFLNWCNTTPYLRTLIGAGQRADPVPHSASMEHWVGNLLNELEQSGAVAIDGDVIRNC